jgi:cell fate regulator YaaT (PSP1 superfamily)
LQDFKKVSIKMAKTQGLSLNPGKISGLCGRLMCCLEYENEYYSDVYKKMPKIGSEVETPDGKGSVVSNNMLKLITRVKIVHADKSEVYRDYPVAELKWTKRDNGQKAEKDDDEEDFKELSD